MHLQEELFRRRDLGYRSFHARLIPGIDPETIIGVRTPEVRKIAKEYRNTPERLAFLEILPHTYYEENNLHAFFVEQERDFSAALEKTERFLPYIDNWATCDSFLPKVFCKTPERLLPEIFRWLHSERTYTVRYAIGLLMKLFLDERFDPKYPSLLAEIQSEEYYVNMMLAWYFATALTKQADSILPYLTESRLPPWVHNKTIQKAIESRRISSEQKIFLKTLKKNFEK